MEEESGEGGEGRQFPGVLWSTVIHGGDLGSRSGLGGQRQVLGGGVIELLWLLPGGQTC